MLTTAPRIVKKETLLLLVTDADHKGWVEKVAQALPGAQHFTAEGAFECECWQYCECHQNAGTHLVKCDRGGTHTDWDALHECDWESCGAECTCCYQHGSLEFVFGTYDRDRVGTPVYGDFLTYEPSSLTDDEVVVHVESTWDSPVTPEWLDNGAVALLRAGVEDEALNLGIKGGYDEYDEEVGEEYVQALRRVIGTLEARAETYFSLVLLDCVEPEVAKQVAELV